MAREQRTAVVTGGAGFIGSHMVERLLHQGWRVRVIDNCSSGRLSNLEQHKNVEFLRADLKKRTHLVSAVRGANTVFHFAANPEVRLSTTKPSLHFGENVISTFNLLEALRKVGGGGLLIFASTAAVYGEQPVLKISEATPPAPISVYGASKASSEMLIKGYSALYGVRSLSLRYANVIGPRSRHGVIYDLVGKLAKNRSSLEILGDGKQTRSYMHVDDAVTATLLALKKLESSDMTYDVYNVGNLDSLTVTELAHLVIETMQVSKVQLSYRPWEHGIGWPGDIKRIVLDMTKLGRLGFKPEMTSRVAVIDTTKSTIEALGQRVHGRR